MFSLKYTVQSWRFGDIIDYELPVMPAVVSVVENAHIPCSHAYTCHKLTQIHTLISCWFESFVRKVTFLWNCLDLVMDNQKKKSLLGFLMSDRMISPNHLTTYITTAACSAVTIGCFCVSLWLHAKMCVCVFLYGWEHGIIGEVVLFWPPHTLSQFALSYSLCFI